MYARDLALRQQRERLLEEARARLDRYARDHGVDPADVLVLDIDATAINALGQRIDGTYALYRRARALGFSVVFLTARYDPQGDGETREQLVAAGYRGLEGNGGGGLADLLLMNPIPPTERGMGAVWKRVAAQVLRQQGYTIVMAVGDRPGDLVADAGGDADVLVPALDAVTLPPQ